MKKFALSALFLTLLTFSACVGTDLVDDPIIAEKVRIAPRSNVLTVGQTQQFSAKFTDKYGIEDAKAAFAWKSSDPTRISIDGQGLARCLTLGEVKISATKGNITDTISINGGTVNEPSEVSGILMGRNNYAAAGGVTLKKLPSGRLKLAFGSNFSVSAGPSVYVLLANHTDGRYTVTNGGQAQNAISLQLSKTRLTQYTGAMEFDVPEGVKITDYKFVVLYCVLGPIFGQTELK
jgi:hypothetical protein